MVLEKEVSIQESQCVQEKTVINLIHTSNWINNHLKDKFDPFNITVQQYNILRIIRGACKPATINLLKEKMLDKMSDASRIVERLVQKGLVDRVICQNDRRAVDISLTQDGEVLLEKLDDSYQVKELIASKLTGEEITSLNLLLDKLRSH